MSPDILSTAGVILVVVPTIEFGGISLLRFLRRRTPGYLDNPVRQSLFRAGHAHAGVLVILALIGLLYLDASDLTGTTRQLVSLCLVAAPILMPAGFFFSVASPGADRPNALIILVYAGAAALAVGTVTHDARHGRRGASRTQG